MKNITILNKGRLIPESRTYPDLEVVTSVFDPVSDSLTVVLSSEEAHLCEVQQFMKTGVINLLASFPIREFDRLISFNHFADSSQLVFVFEQGDLVTATYDFNSPDPDTTVVEIVGSIDCGLKCSSWSPDEETLTLLTQENNVLLLSRLFEPIAEKYLDPAEVNLKTQVSVGWGKKETQFQGKGAKQIERERLALKHAGLDLNEEELRDPTLNIIQQGSLSEYDSLRSSISWRGDCAYFAISTIETVDESQRRVIRVYSRDGELDSCSEPVDGLEDVLSWKPQGSLILSTQRRFEPEIEEEVLDLVFFERNGLRHGEFTTRLPPTSKVIGLSWSSDSEILCFQLQNSIQLWTCKNYHWSLKQEIFSTEPINFIKFHQEKPLRIMFGTSSSVEIVDLAYKMVNGPSVAPLDIGMTCFIDGTTCLVTPLSIANVPPPVSYREFDCHEPIIDVSISQNNEIYACLTSNEINLATVTVEEMKSGKHPKIVSTLHKSEVEISDFEHVRQIAIIKNDTLVVLYDTEINSKFAIIDIADLSQPLLITTVSIMPKVLLLKQRADFETLTYETVQSKVFQLENGSFESVELTQFPSLCHSYEVGVLPKAASSDASEWETSQPSLACFGISSNGKLFANERQLASAVTSIKITESYLLYTTAQHQLKFIHLSADAEFKVPEESSAEQDNSTLDERIRMIERGSLLISCMPSKSAVVLQAPRGNLETIYPRIMTLTGVRTDIKNKNYKNAFLTCRTHRIDLDILYDYDPELFHLNVELFINQIEKVEYLDLFFSCLHEEDVTKSKYKETLTLTGDENLTRDLAKLNINKKEVKKSKVNTILEAALEVMLKPEYSQKYLQTIITAYACEKPPNLEAALNLIGSFTKGEEIEKAVTHVCFLQDVNKLYNVALSLYNIPLTLIIAQQSQKDPKEYLPFLQNLHVQEDLRKKFLIDTHLKYYEKALDSLTQIKDVDQEEVNNYVVEHSLYKHALSIYRNNQSNSDIILELYAKYLHQQTEFTEAAITYEYLGKHELALEDYILAKKWREAISTLKRYGFSDKLTEVCERLVTALTDDHKYTFAAEIEFKYLKNTEAALKLYCKEYNFEIAILTCIDEDKLNLIEEVVDPALGEGFGVIAELLADCKLQVNSQLTRLRELRTKKEEDPYAFYGDGIDNADTPDNVSIAASETSTKESFFTRYTGKTAGTAKTGASRRTAKNKRREERKKARGKKGTIYEEEYLVQSTGRLIERLEQTEQDLVKLIEGLLRRSRKEQAYQIQKNFVDLLQLLKDNVEEIYNISERDRERLDDNGLVYYVPEIPVPSIKDFPKKNTLDF